MVEPSLVPGKYDTTIYIVLNDFGELGSAYVEADETEADESTIVSNIIEGTYSNPLRVVAFNTHEGWSRDVTVDIADELRRRYVEFGEVPDSILEFLEANRR